MFLCLESLFDSKFVERVVLAYICVLYVGLTPIQHWIAHEIHSGRNKKPDEALTFTQSLAETLHGYAIAEYDADSEHEKED